MRVLSIQSSVAHGHVGNSGAVFVLQRLGVDVTRLDTVALSNHPAHGSFTGSAAKAGDLATLVAGLAERGFLARCDAVLSGYLGTAANGLVVADTVQRLLDLRPDAIYCLDPVMGDRPKGLFVKPDIPGVMAERLLPLADIATPNAFELELLSGMPVTDSDSALAAARALLSRGPRLIVATGISDEANVTTLAVTAGEAWRVTQPLIAVPAHGAGDCFTAAFLARWLEKHDPARALGLAAGTVAAILAATAASGADELRLIAAQDAIPAPQRLPTAVKIG